MGCCSINSFWDLKSFCFQFSATLSTLIVLTQLSCTIGCTITFIGTSIVLIFISWKITKLIRKLYFHGTLSPLKKAVLVTGCDSGFGHRLANRLNNHGYTVYACCLDPTGTGPQQLLKTSAFPNATKLISMDVTSDFDVQRAYDEVSASLEKDGQKLWAIVNNSGIYKYGHIEWGKLEEYQKVFDVNTIGMVRVSRAFLPFIRKSRGRVVNVASIAGRIVGEGVAIYCMSKHAVIAFSAALRREMLPWGVKVSTIEPAFYKTPLVDATALSVGANKIWSETHESIRNEYGQEYFDDQLSFMLEQGGRDNPEEVVDAMFDAISAVDPEIAYRVCGLDYSILWFFFDYVPCALFDVILKFRMPKVKPKTA